MTAHTPRVRLLFVAGLGLLLTIGSDAAQTRRPAKSIFVSVLDSSGRPVIDLTGADFAVREDGTDREKVIAGIFAPQ